MDGVETRFHREPRLGCAPIGWDSLTERQRGIAGLVAEGLTNRAVAQEVYLSPHTVDFHLRQIFRKLGITSRVMLTGRVFEHMADV